MDINAKNYLMKEGISVRGFNGRLEKFIRVTIGKKEENDKFIDLLKEYLNEKNK